MFLASSCYFALVRRQARRSRSKVRVRRGDHRAFRPAPAAHHPLDGLGVGQDVCVLRSGGRFRATDSPCGVLSAQAADAGGRNAPGACAPDSGLRCHRSHRDEQRRRANARRGSTLPVITVPASVEAHPEDVWSSLRMPSKVPVMTVLSPGNAVLAALNILSARNPRI